ncbi:MAG: hypothetical protein DPW18_14810 [Chloroflexi bacterium]|nr:hypothetical protein [Chloroflexota bacterium]MDL1942302.1 hypothetical protein [Chloroflexi bacterium CFX2]
MLRRRSRTFLLSIVTILALACVPTLSPASAPIPTLDPNAPFTAIVQTAGAAATQTALFAPPTATPTVTPTRTPTETPTPTPTFLFLVPPTHTVPPTLIPVGSSGLEFECQVISQEPANESVLTAGVRFEARWIVANVGKAAWDSDNADYRYSEGTRMYLQSIYDFPATISPGVTVELSASMQAPSNPGTYTTTWTITIGKRSFCPMKLTINVQ